MAQSESCGHRQRGACELQGALQRVEAQARRVAGRRVASPGGPGPVHGGGRGQRGEAAPGAVV